ncbi:FkbM family methyltransferase [Actinocorallia sp. A-T 12471]|uniref:FkbM family methyltransferase n=1 Tax=Actinocorallia sp. A-T 12471 TaxID=3089813 RepID=UPI0029D30330|nr:FkbM family methyltransferase [Actinocorallia sp. A-T 12471]MDX6743823.1 FkbM family methyltransferase [Actinocorallia sp. A-T 12471]
MSQRLSRAVAELLPARVVGAAVRAVYPRVEPELRRLHEFVSQGGTAVDVGGWFGPWTARLLRRADHVVTVEADPGLAALLAKTFPAARVIAAAASDRDGVATLYSPPTGPLVGVSTLERAEGVASTVKTITLDALNLSDVRFLKIDIEGHELPALRGAARTIQRDHPVILLELETRHQPVDAVTTLLDSWGYSGQILTDDGWQSLSGFDLASHQEAQAAQLTRSFPSRVLFPGTRYLNSVLFRHHSWAR